MTNVILCGGSGTRLWPISRRLMPKQFVKLINDKSLFQMTLQRNERICKSQLIVSNSEQYFLALDQLKKKAQFLLEPVGRNTAPAIALSCMALNEDEIVLVTPSDHLIKVEASYQHSVNRAKELAKEGYLVTFGIKPLRAESGYGYIEADGEDVKSFKEKPDVKESNRVYQTRKLLLE